MRYKNRDRLLAGFCLALVACDNPPPAANDPGAHEHRAPHAGCLVVLGEEFAHVEFVLDPQTGSLTAYVLDGNAENAVRLAQEELNVRVQVGEKAAVVSLGGVSNVLTGEKLGDTSQFEGREDLLKGASRFEAEIQEVSIKGSNFRGVGFVFPNGNE